MKRVFIVHGWSGFPGECWFPWLKHELEKRGFHVTVPQMPDADAPKIEKWVPHLAKTIGKPDKDTYLVGHSIGCQTILRYLQSIHGEVGGAVFVAGFFLKLVNLESPEEERVAEPWMTTPLDFKRIKQAAKKCIAIFSDNDPFVPLENAEGFVEKLDAEIVTVKSKGHMGASDNCPELPEALHAVLELAR